MNKAGRNDPCPCGSGKKYKKCCGAKTAPGRKKIEAAVIHSNGGRGLFQMVKQAGELYQMNKEDAEKKRQEKEQKKKEEEKKPEKKEKEFEHEEKPGHGPPEHVSPPPTKKQKGGW
ncbi:MAG: hypothetical protein Tsb0015_09780 [Simkaniaceae bacterium]